jgi:hypothetical protein
MKKIIFSLIVLLFLALWVNLGWFNPNNPALSRNSRNAQLAALSPALIKSIQEQIVILLAKIAELQKELNALILQETTAVATTTATTTVTAVASPKAVNWQWATTYPNITVSSGYQTLTEFKITADSKIAVKKLRFKNNGTLNASYLADIVLRDRAGYKFAQINSLSASDNNIIEFNLLTDESKPNKGLLVSGDNYYSVFAFIRSFSSGSAVPTFRLDVESISDIEAVDFNDLSKPVELTGVSFPIQGPVIRTY